MVCGPRSSFVAWVKYGHKIKPLEPRIGMEDSPNGPERPERSEGGGGGKIQETMEEDDLFVAVGVFGLLRPGDKLSVNEGEITIHRSSNLFENLMTKLRRNYYLESKKNSFAFIKKVMCHFLSRVDGILDVYDTTNPNAKDQKIELTRMVEYLNNATRGLTNLQETYQQNVNMVSRLTRQLDKIGSMLDRIDSRM